MMLNWQLVPLGQLQMQLPMEQQVHRHLHFAIPLILLGSCLPFELEPLPKLFPPCSFHHLSYHQQELLLGLQVLKDLMLLVEHSIY